jgi:hypothetical protein
MTPNQCTPRAPQNAHVIRPPPRLERILEADVSIIVSSTQFQVVSRQALQRENPASCGHSGTGATGLEPATSGVTGRVGPHDARQRTPLSRLICRCFSSPRHIVSAWLSQSSKRRLGHEWATETCLDGQRNADARDVAGAACSAVRRLNSTPLYHFLVLATIGNRRRRIRLV